MIKMRRTLVAAMAVAAFAAGVALTVFAAQREGPGNGGGQRGQGTGPQDDRPAGCRSQGGPGDRGSN